MARAADKLSVEERIERITNIFSTFRNPDKETVLTPWRVVNMHLGDCLGGYNFYDTEYQNEISEPRFIDKGEVTTEVFSPESHILEINSKSGLYPLYMAYGIYRARVKSSLFSVSNIVIQSAINSLGTVVMAASSAAFNIEILTFDIIDAFSQACTTFVGQNYGAGKIERCKKTLKLCMFEGLAALVLAIAILLFFGKPLLSIFNNDPKVVETGYIRLMYVMFSHIFNLLYNVMSGYLRGFSISLAPAILTMLGVCGMRIAWIHYVFPLSPTFKTIMIAYPVSLGITALMISATVLYYRPSKRFAGTRDTV